MSLENQNNLLGSLQLEQKPNQQRTVTEKSGLNDSFKEAIDMSECISPKLCESSVYTKRQDLPSDSRINTEARPRVSQFEETLRKADAEIPPTKLDFSKSHVPKQQPSKVFRNVQIQASDHILIKNREYIPKLETPVAKKHRKRPNPAELSISDKKELCQGFDRSKFIWIVQRLFNARTKAGLKQIRAFAQVRKMSSEAQKKTPHFLSKETFVEQDLLASTGDLQPQHDHRSSLLQSTKHLFDSAQQLKQFMSVLQTSAAFTPEQVYSARKLQSDPSIEKYREANHLNKFDLPITYNNSRGPIESVEEKLASPFSDRINLAMQQHEIEKKKFLYASEATPSNFFAMPKPLYPPKINFGSRSTSVAQMTAIHYKKLTDSLTSSQLPSSSYINPLFGRRNLHNDQPSAPRSPPPQDRTPVSRTASTSKKPPARDAVQTKTEPAKKSLNLQQPKTHFHFLPKPPSSKPRKKSWTRPRDRDNLSYDQFQQILSTLASKKPQ